MTLWTGALAGKRESLEREKRYVCKDGSTVWAHVVAQVVRDAAGRASAAMSGRTRPSSPLIS